MSAPSPKSAFGKASVKPTPDIATKSELLWRLRNRPKPANEMHLRPQGMGVANVNRQTEHQNNQRIEALRGRLKNAENSFSKGIAHTQSVARNYQNSGRSR